MVRWLCMLLACFAMVACDTSGSGTAEALAKPPKPPVTCPPGQAPNAGGKCKPIPVQPPVSCPDGTTVPAGQTCPPVSCPDGTQQPNGSTCPPVNCPDGTQVPNGQTCPPPLPPVNCPDGSTHPAGYVCPPPPPVQCPDGSTVPSGSQCPVIPPPVTWTLCAAGEGDTCYVVGSANVRYGAEGKFITKSVTGSISCDFDNLRRRPGIWHSEALRHGRTGGHRAAIAAGPVPRWKHGPGWSVLPYHATAGGFGVQALEPRCG
jgi:hypothetical protein